MMRKHYYISIMILGIIVLLACCMLTGEKEIYNSKGNTYFLTDKEALKLVFDYEYASWDNLLDVSYYETDGVIGYMWLTPNDMTCPMYLTVSDSVLTAQGHEYCIIRLAKDIYGTSGEYYRTETYNEFAVNKNTSEIIEMRVYLEEGGWDYSEEYKKKVLGVEE